MIISTAQLKFYRQSAKKVRQIADVLRGVGVQDARSQLAFQTQKSARMFLKLLNSAIANAMNKEQNGDKPNMARMYIKEIRVDEGPAMKRYTPKAFGRATVIRKKTSHIHMALGIKKYKGEKTSKSKNTPATK